MRKNIALVDDDRNILTSVSMLLEAEGFQIKTYNDGASALEGLNQTPPDLAIFDIKMPRMDGMELLNRIRKTQQFPVIFLTSKDEEIDEVLGLRMGADDFIRKPFSQRLLLERIRAVLHRIANGLYNLGLDLRRRATAEFGAIERSAADHQKIVDAIAAQDPEGAAQAMKEHLDHIEESTQRMMMLEATEEQARNRLAPTGAS